VSRRAFIIHKSNRAAILQEVQNAPDGYRVEIAERLRTDSQNRAQWPLLSKLASGLTWHGLTLSEDDWKDLLTASFRKEARVVPNLEGNGFVALGMRTSNMSVPEFSDYLEFIHAFAAREGVDLSREDAA